LGLDRFSKHTRGDIDFFRSRIDIPYLDRRNQKLFGLIVQDRQKAVLEVGCGEGIALHYIRPIKYVGVDTSRVRLRFASNLFKDHSFIQADGTSLPFSSGQFDLVFCNGTLHHLSKQKIFLMIQEMKRTCKKGGWVAIIEPNAYNFSSLMLALLHKEERGILHCKSKAFLSYFERSGIGYEIKLRYDGTFAPIVLFAHLFREKSFIRAPWFNKLWERIDYVVNRITPKRFWSNVIILAKK
jgi:SAM-dependent methyltransferase